MKRWTCLIPIFVSVVILAMIVQAVPVEAQEAPPQFTVEIIDYPTTVQPGGSYNIRVRVTKPADMVLPAWVGEERWEVRVYFYDGLNCYSQGEWTLLGGTYLYSGWWNWRTQGDSWTAAMSSTREFIIPIKVVASPRPSEDIQRGMNEIPVGGDIKLKARLRLRGMTVNFLPDNQLTFTYYGQIYGGAYTQTGTNTYRVGNVYLEQSAAGYYQIDYDTIKSGIAVSAAAGFTIPLIVIIPVVILLIVVAVVVVVLKKRGGAEVPPPPPPPSL